MARVVVASAARDDLDELIRSHSLPADTRERVKRSLRPLSRFPLVGGELHGRWRGHRFVLGPWRWLVIVYDYDEQKDRVRILAFRDGRTATARR